MRQTNPVSKRKAPLPAFHCPYTPQQWSQRCNAPLPLELTEQQIAQLKGINDQLSLAEVATIYWPLANLLNQYIHHYQQRQSIVKQCIGQPPVPYLIGIAGSVAAGKSTSARVLQLLLSRWPRIRKVELVTTDGFLYPNSQLQSRGLMQKKGFPQSYDRSRLQRFVADIKAGCAEVKAPCYSHLAYDILPDQYQYLQQPEVVILEGLNVLQQHPGDHRSQLQRFVTDFLDFSIYIDAVEPQLKQWYIQRFLTFCRGDFLDADSYFYHYANLPAAKAVSIASEIWDNINAVNLQQNILPTRQHAQLILTKGADHLVEQVWLHP